MAELEGVAAPLRQQLGEVGEAVGVGGKIRRKLKQDRADLAVEEGKAILQ
jgi:hypothetical protein